MSQIHMMNVPAGLDESARLLVYLTSHLYYFRQSVIVNFTCVADYYKIGGILVVTQWLWTGHDLCLFLLAVSVEYAEIAR